MSKPDWLPNWKNPSEYPDVDTTSIEQWAWEFLRRNKNYQKNFLRAAEASETAKEMESDLSEFQVSIKKYISDLNSEIETETDKEFLTGEIRELEDTLREEQSSLFSEQLTVYDFLTRYRLNKSWSNLIHLFNPSNNYKEGVFDKDITPSFCMVSEDSENWVNGDSDAGEMFGGLDDGELMDKGFLCFLYSSTEILVKFDVSLSIDKQLSSIKKVLTQRKKKLAQLDFIESPSDPRKVCDNYQSYLRVLDAKQSGISNKDIANHLFPELGADNNKAEDKGQTNIRNHLKAATALSEKDWERILFID
ncbi:transcriptional regulator domain-containing protein [Candidatus Magnetaquicoccus inordinatus]|uniref:transcriptional regulator domain-containing protein n=1 Tax=Candidatus Magnetaquicoccus inordinatus TaxID=2496818 RepID=UPI00102CC507|nr:DUF6499 domain-containing protein [Candidatus Magnetaquicoccus inordinatus]